MKFWSIFDVMTDHWMEVSHTYHIRSYIYLMENYGVCIVSLVVGTYFERVRRCAQHKKVFVNDKVYIEMQQEKDKQDRCL